MMQGMLTQYISEKLQKAQYKILDDGTYFGEISTASGVWAQAKTLEKCRAELQEVLEDWVLIQVAQHKKVQGLSVNIPKLTAEYA